MDISFLESAWLTCSLLSLVTPNQDPEIALVREPGQRRYGPPRQAADLAKESWEYGLLSAWAYRNEWAEKVVTTATADLDDTERWQDIIDANWTRWTDIPSDALRESAERRGLYFDIYESSGPGKTRVVIAFRGTEGLSWLDWRANLRWVTRFIPKFHDQYSVVAEELVDAFGRQLVARGLNRGDVEIITTGHSLGGGLAQQFAYAFRAPEGSNVRVQPVSRVYAFHPSPVTGWFSVAPEIRAHNVKDLRIDRIFEHGEVLAYIRLLLGRFYPPSASKPVIREIRFNFVDSKSTSINHEIGDFAFHLADKAHA